MKRRKTNRGRRSSLSSDVADLVGANVALGIGGAVVGGLGGSTAGISSAAGMMPVVGTAMMGKHVLRGVSKMGGRERAYSVRVRGNKKWKVVKARSRKEAAMKGLGCL